MFKIKTNIDQVIKNLDRVVQDHTNKVQDDLAAKLSRLRCPEHHKAPRITKSSNTVSAKPCCSHLEQMIRQTVNQFK